MTTAPCREHRQARAAAQHDLNRLQRQARRGLRSLRKESETTAIVAGAKLTELIRDRGERALSRMTDKLTPAEQRRLQTLLQRMLDTDSEPD